MREPVEALTCDLPSCSASLMAPRSHLSTLAAQTGWGSRMCPTHTHLESGSWRVYALAHQEQIVRTAAVVLTGAGGRSTGPPERYSSGLWRASVTCQGMDRAQRLAHAVFGVGAAAMCSPSR